MIGRSIAVDGWFLLDLAVLIGFAAWGRISGYRDGWHRGRKALLREQQIQRASDYYPSPMRELRRESKAGAHAWGVFDQEAEA